MTTEVERELCALCAERMRMVPTDKGTRVRCGGPNNPYCPGFVPERRNAP